GAVIWAERLRRLGRKAPDAVDEALALLADRELVPLTGDGVAFASAMASILLETMDQGAARRAAIETVGARLGALTPFLHPGGLFLVLAGDAANIDPSLVYRP
ncbi:MAG: hypothetical protein GY704_14105, partial [Phycisphaeraceae bacterium]|nr:hypothetical protein [Phycisphaeraceae bacterium]